MASDIKYMTIDAVDARLRGFDDYYHPHPNEVNFCVKCRSDWGSCPCLSADRGSARITYTITGENDAHHT